MGRSSDESVNRVGKLIYHIFFNGAWMSFPSPGSDSADCILRVI